MASSRVPDAVKQAASKVPHLLKGHNFRWMPTHKIVVQGNLRRDLNPDKIKLRVPPSMNKFEIKEYMEKIYGVQVFKVETTNFRGAAKTYGTARYSRRPDFKNATVHLVEVPDKRDQQEGDE